MMYNPKLYYKSIRVGKLFRLSGAGYETLLLGTGIDDDERKLIEFSNSIKGTELAKWLGHAIDEAWYVQNDKDIKMLEQING